MGIKSMTLEVVLDLLEGYIRTHTERNEYGYITYTGNIHYLEQYRILRDKIDSSSRYRN